METVAYNPPSHQISPDKLLAIVRGVARGSAERPTDDDSHPPGPFGPVIREAVKHWLRLLASTHPELYDLPQFGGPIFHDRVSRVALNPQPLPPRYLLMLSLAQAVVSRAELMQDLASAMTNDAEKRGIIIVSGYVASFVREVRQAQFQMPLRSTVVQEKARHGRHIPLFHLDVYFDVWPWVGHRPPPPPPPEHPDWNEKLSGVDLVILGTAFAEAAKSMFDQELRHAFADAAAQLTEAGTARIA